MSAYSHGGGIHQAAAELQRPLSDLLDFSASINPLGMPAAVLDAARAALGEAVHYPEIHADSLAAALADHHYLDRRHFLPGNGSTPLFALFARTLRPRRALVVRPAFSEYQRALELAGTIIDYFDLAAEEEFRLDPDRLLAAMTPTTDLLLIANPGNPSGALIDPELLLSLIRSLKERAVVAIDEAFIDFSPQASILPAIASEPNLYLFRSLTKFYAIPGLRAGYLAGPPAGIARLQEEAEAWALSNVAIAAAKAALQATEYRQESLRLIPILRRELAAGLGALGLKVFPAAANYLLVRLEDGDADEVVSTLRREGILLRSCDNFPPLDGSYLRIAVRTSAENQRLLLALANYSSMTPSPQVTL